MSPVATVWSYEFSIWPDESKTWGKAAFELFSMLNTRISLTFTEDEFSSYRRSLLLDGITLREVTRIPYYKPETIS